MNKQEYVSLENLGGGAASEMFGAELERVISNIADIDQPESKFVLRIKADKEHGPKCALFEADGGAWKNTAVATIKAWLALQLGDGLPIIA